MTDGTSQGLFIVVAIVIFGIFVVLAYILFEDTLSPAMANMFTDSVDMAIERVKQPHVTTKHWITRTSEELKSDFFENNGRKIVLKNNPGQPHRGLYVNSTYFEKGKQYVLTFDYRLVEGSIRQISGHLEMSDNTKVFVDDIPYDSNWYTPPTKLFPQDNKHHRVRVEFNTNKYIENAVGIANHLFIQPNRGNQDTYYHVEFKNVYITELK